MGEELRNLNSPTATAIARSERNANEQLALEYHSRILGPPPKELDEDITHRARVMLEGEEYRAEFGPESILAVYDLFRDRHIATDFLDLYSDDFRKLWIMQQLKKMNFPVNVSSESLELQDLILATPLSLLEVGEADPSDLPHERHGLLFPCS